MPAAGSAAQEAKQILGEGTEVTAAFQIISHELLLNDLDIECGVLVTGSSKNARAETLKLGAAAGLTCWDAGPIAKSGLGEGVTRVCCQFNKQYSSSRSRTQS